MPNQTTPTKPPRYDEITERAAQILFREADQDWQPRFELGNGDYYGAEVEMCVCQALREAGCAEHEVADVVGGYITNEARDAATVALAIARLTTAKIVLVLTELYGATGGSHPVRFYQDIYDLLRTRGSDGRSAILSADLRKLSDTIADRVLLVATADNAAV